jgi:rubrerythrin
LDSKEFVNNLLNEVGLGDKRREEEERGHEPQENMQPEEEGKLPPDILYWLYHAVYYEKSAASFIGGWLKDTKEMDTFENFGRQIEDESLHYVWLREQLHNFGGDFEQFQPSNEWKYLMEDFYPKMETTVERLAAHNIASESSAWGFMNVNFERFPDKLRTVIKRVMKDEKYHIEFAKNLLEKYCQTPEQQELAMQTTRQTLGLMRDAATAYFRGQNVS